MWLKDFPLNNVTQKTFFPQKRDSKNVFPGQMWLAGIFPQRRDSKDLIFTYKETCLEGFSFSKNVIGGLVFLEKRDLNDFFPDKRERKNID